MSARSCRPCRLCSHGYAHLGACPAEAMLWWTCPPQGRHVLHHLVRAVDRPDQAIGHGSWTADGGRSSAIAADVAALAITDDLGWVERVLAEAAHLSCGRTLAESLRAAALDAVVRLTRS